MRHPVRRPGALIYLFIILNLFLLSSNADAAINDAAHIQFTAYIDISTAPMPVSDATKSTAGEGGLFNQVHDLYQQVLAYFKFENKPWLAWLILGLIVLIALILFKALQLLYYRRELEAINSRAQKMLAALYEIDNPLHIRLGQLRGNSRKQIASVREAFDELLQHAVSFDTALKKLTIPPVIGSGWLKQWKESVSNLDAYETILTDIKTDWGNFQSTEQQMHDRFTVCNNPLQEANRLLKEAIDKTKFPLTAIAEELGNLTERASYAQSLLISDPVEVAPLMDNVPERVEALRKDISEVMSLFDIYQQLSGDIASTRHQLEKRVAEEQLKVIDDKPFRFLEQVPMQLDIIKEHLEHGRHHKPRQLIEALLAHQSEAMAAIENLAEIRDRHRIDIANIEMEISQFRDSMVHALHAEIDRVKPIFAEVHWKSFPDRINKLSAGRTWLVSMKEELDALMEPGVQQFDRATELIEACQKRIASMQETIQQARNLQTDLYNQLTNARNLLPALEDRLKKRLQLMQDHDLPRFQKLDEPFAECRRQLAEETQRIEAQPYDLKAARERRERLEKAIDQFEALSDQYLALQAKATQQASQFLSELRAAYNQHGTFLSNKSFYRKQISTITDNFKRQIESGQYSYTLGQIEELTPMIIKMKMEHTREELARN